MVDRDRTVVLGLGNILCGDEGFGVVALLAVRAQVGHIPGVDWLDGGVMGLDLLPVVESSSRLLILDAIDTGMDPGSLIEFDKGDIPLFGGIKLSEHQVSFQEVLALARFRQSLPEHLRLIGVQPDDTSTGIGLSQAADSAMGGIIQAAERVLHEWVYSGAEYRTVLDR